MSKFFDKVSVLDEQGKDFYIQQRWKGTVEFYYTNNSGLTLWKFKVPLTLTPKDIDDLGVGVIKNADGSVYVSVSGNCSGTQISKICSLVSQQAQSYLVVTNYDTNELYFLSGLNNFKTQITLSLIDFKQGNISKEETVDLATFSGGVYAGYFSGRLEPFFPYN